MAWCVLTQVELSLAVLYSRIVRRICVLQIAVKICKFPAFAHTGSHGHPVKYGLIYEPLYRLAANNNKTMVSR